MKMSLRWSWNYTEGFEGRASGVSLGTEEASLWMGETASEEDGDGDGESLGEIVGDPAKRPEGKLGTPEGKLGTPEVKLGTPEGKLRTPEKAEFSAEIEEKSPRENELPEPEEVRSEKGLEMEGTEEGSLWMEETASEDGDGDGESLGELVGDPAKRPEGKLGIPEKAESWPRIEEKSPRENGLPEPEEVSPGRELAMEGSSPAGTVVLLGEKSRPVGEDSEGWVGMAPKVKPPRAPLVAEGKDGNEREPNRPSKMESASSPKPVNEGKEIDEGTGNCLLAVDRVGYQWTEYNRG